MSFTNAAYAVFRREFDGYFATPLAYVFIVIFLLAMGSFTFYFGQFYETGRAELDVFFGFHPWLRRSRCACGRKNRRAERSSCC